MDIPKLRKRQFTELLAIPVAADRKEKMRLYKQLHDIDVMEIMRRKVDEVITELDEALGSESERGGENE